MYGWTKPEILAARSRAMEKVRYKPLSLSLLYPFLLVFSDGEGTTVQVWANDGPVSVYKHSEADERPVTRLPVKARTLSESLPASVQHSTW